MQRFLFLLLAVAIDIAIDAQVFGQQTPKPAAPTSAAVPYGTHPRQVLDFYQAESQEPTPVVIYIHGGAWLSGTRTVNPVSVQFLHHAKISVVAISYRFTTDADGLEPPVKAPLMDAARAVQFVRSKAAEWNIDKNRVAAAGGSAGGFSALWLAFHDDMADPKSDDPVLRQSTRLACVAVSQSQTTLDPKLMQEWTPNAEGGAHAFGITGFKRFLAEREKLLPWIKEYSPIDHVTADDPPVGLYYGGKPMLGQPQGDPLHNPNWGVPLAAKCKDVGVECLLSHAEAPPEKLRTVESFLIAKLRPKKS